MHFANKNEVYKELNDLIPELYKIKKYFKYRYQRFPRENEESSTFYEDHFRPRSRKFVPAFYNDEIILNNKTNKRPRFPRAWKLSRIIVFLFDPNC